MPSWLQVLISGFAVLFSGAGLVGFWAWARAQILRLSIDVAEYKTKVDERFAAINERCSSRERALSEITAELRALIKELRENDTETAKAVSELQGYVKGAKV